MDITQEVLNCLAKDLGSASAADIADELGYSVEDAQNALDQLGEIESYTAYTITPAHLADLIVDFLRKSGPSTLDEIVGQFNHLPVNIRRLGFHAAREAGRICVDRTGAHLKWGIPKTN